MVSRVCMWCCMVGGSVVLMLVVLVNVLSCVSRFVDRVCCSSRF